MGPSMIIFLFTFLCLYGGINFYFFFRAKSIFHFSGLLQGVFLVIIILLILAPILVRVLESLHYETSARAVACIGYVWMAFVFLFIFSSLLLEVIRIVLKVIVPEAGSPALVAATFGLAVFLSAALVVYGYIGRTARSREKTGNQNQSHFARRRKIADCTNVGCSCGYYYSQQPTGTGFRAGPAGCTRHSGLHRRFA